MKNILISGAGSGLGKALALRYAADGDEVCVVDLNAEAGNAVADLIISKGGNAFFMQGDITQQANVDELVTKLGERWQGLDVLINNAGVATAGMLETESIEQWQWVLDINVLGHVRMTKAFLPLLKNSTLLNRGAAIINIASQAGLTSAPGMGSYCATKAAMVSISETFHLELAHDGIHVAVVCPAFFNTNLNQSLRSGDAGMQSVVTKLIKKSGVSADDIAEQVFASVKAGKYMIITHADGLKAYRMKRFLPIERYLSFVKKRTKRFVKKSD